MNGLEVGEYLRHRSGAEEFRYAPSWLERDHAIPLSRSLPLTDAVHKGDVVINYFDNLLPDNPEIRRRIQTTFQVQTETAFDLLAAIGRDCVGAVQLLPEKGVPDVRKIEGTPRTEAETATELRNLKTRPLGMSGAEDFRISLAGAQAKTALLRHQNIWMKPHGATPTTHIVKLPIGQIAMDGGQVDLADSVENEYLCLRLLEAFGLPTPEVSIARFEEIRVLVVKRFDRIFHDTWIARLPQEDLCQALGIAPGLKYERDGGPGIVAIMNLLSAATSPLAARRQFMKSMYLFWLLAATDGHGKNFSIFLNPRGFGLTPVYDVLSVYPYFAKRQLEKPKAKMAMGVYGQRKYYRWGEILSRHWLTTSEKVHFPEGQMQAIIEEVRETAPRVVEQVVSQLPTDFPESVFGPVAEGIREAINNP